MLSYFENRKTAYFDFLCLDFSIETKIKTLFLLSPKVPFRFFDKLKYEI